MDDFHVARNIEKVRLARSVLIYLFKVFILPPSSLIPIITYVISFPTIHVFQSTY